MQPSSLKEALLDSPPEPEFDRLTKFACNLLDVPVAVVSIVDDHRQFFKSQCGMGEPNATRRETPLSHSFCKYVASSAEPLIVEDARVHELVKGNPAIEENGVVAYLGVPLFDTNGEAFGAFCAIDHQPRVWTQGDVETLRLLAAQAITETVLRKAVTQQADHLEDLRRSDEDRAWAVRADRHRLRTPLNALLMALQTIEYSGELGSENLEFLRMAERNGRAVMTMIDEMLDHGSLLSREEVAPVRRLLSPLELMARALEQVAGLAAASGLKLSSTAETTAGVAVDGETVVCVLVKLLGNAIKFTSQGGTIDVRAEEYFHQGQRAVLFSVRDTGIGISAGWGERIFEERPPEESSNGTRHHGERGLVYCQRVIEAHAGRIWFESEPGKGSVFSFVIPAA